VEGNNNSSVLWTRRDLKKTRKEHLKLGKKMLKRSETNPNESMPPFNKATYRYL
jgi:hypothetical protein